MTNYEQVNLFLQPPQCLTNEFLCKMTRVGDHSLLNNLEFLTELDLAISLICPFNVEQLSGVSQHPGGKLLY